MITSKARYHLCDMLIVRFFLFYTMNIMKIENNKSLKEYATFAIDVSAKYFTTIISEEDISQLLETPQWYNETHCILGGGSNILFTGNYDGIIIHNKILGKEIISETDSEILVRVGAGENWHDLVMWSVSEGYWGIENLALIPGTVGASPVQNIGAYGVEVKDTIVSVDAVDVISGEKKVYTYAECEFEYRSSFFKENEGEYMLTYVTFGLSKKAKPQLSYKDIKAYLGDEENPTIQEIANAVISIRNSKLPKVGEIAMAGSFFKNPIIEKAEANLLINKFPDLKYFPTEDGKVKVSAGWIIEYLGFKGLRVGDVGTYSKHALVLVNYGHATGQEVWEFAQKIIQKTYDVFGIDLEPEVRVL